MAAHLQSDGLTVDGLDAGELVTPAAVVDVRLQVAANADYALSLDEMTRWEARHGRILAESVVLLVTGWEARWPDEAAYLNCDAEGVMHFPGFSPQTVQWLVDERGVRGLGIDTPGIDPGCDTAFRSNQQLLQGRRFHLENLARLDRLPPTGAWLFIGALPLVGGTGSPARVIAFVPS
jgi:kynurenine formamidase